MTHRKRLKLASLMFAVLWTLWMIWSLSPLHPVLLGLLVVCGALAGLGWYWLFGAWYRWFFAGHLFPRKRMS
jgi:hypothetical protein